MGRGGEYIYISRIDLELIQPMLQHWSGGAVHRVCPAPVDTQVPVPRGLVWCRLVPPPLWALPVGPPLWANHCSLALVGEQWGMEIPQSLLHRPRPSGLRLSHPHCAMGVDRAVLLTLLTPLTLCLAKIQRPTPCALALGKHLSVQPGM